jgi:hypothetical protein
MRRCAVPVPLGLTPENLVQAEECFIARLKFPDGLRLTGIRSYAALGHKTSRSILPSFRIMDSTTFARVASPPPRSFDPF